MNIYWLFLLVFIFIFSCSKQNNEDTFVTAPINEDYSSIIDPYERWQSYNLNQYSIDEKRWCECFPPNSFTAYIIDNKVQDVDYEISKENYYNRTEDEIEDYTKNAAMTINKAFSIIEQYRYTAHRLEIDYDSKFGFPSRIFIDIDTLIADEEIIREFSNLKRIIN